jgi:hypothetical protein
VTEPLRAVVTDFGGVLTTPLLEVNLPPARAAGMHAIHYRDADQAIAELDALFG